MTITCKYSCPLCGLIRIEVAVPIRQSEGVVEWMEQTVIQFLAADHYRRSPHCHPTELKDVMIPITGADKIGGPPVH